MTPCITFDKHILRNGYGQQKADGKLRLAHRHAYCLHHGLKHEDIADLVIRHRCDNRACINPDHLEVGTQADNVQDAVERKRHPHGAAHGCAKVTDADVLAIRSRYSKGSPTNGQGALAREFKVSQQLISAIVKRQRWAHI